MQTTYHVTFSHITMVLVKVTNSTAAYPAYREISTLLEGGILLLVKDGPLYSYAEALVTSVLYLTFEPTSHSYLSLLFPLLDFFITFYLLNVTNNIVWSTCLREGS